MDKKLLLVIASNQFRDEELFHTQEELNKAGITTTIASSTMNTSTGMLGGTATPDTLLKNVDMKDYDGIVFIGGAGSSEYWDNETAHKLATTAYNDGKVTAAICIAPVTLANAGLLKGKKFNCWESETEKIKGLGGVHYPEPVVADGNIVTANGPDASRDFGRRIAELLR